MTNAMTLDGTSPNESFRSKIEACIREGTVLPLNYREILNSQTEPEPQDTAVVYVEISLKESFTEIGKLAGLFGGQSLAQIVPPGVLPACTYKLPAVEFVLATASEDVIAVGCTMTIEDGSGNPVTWNAIEYGGKPVLSIALNSIKMSWAGLGARAPILMGTLSGTLAVGSVPLEVTVGFPSLQITIRERPGTAANFGELFARFGWPSNATFDALELSEFMLSADIGHGSFSLFSQISTSNQEPLDLIAGQLAFQHIGLSLYHAAGSTEATLFGELVCRDYLAIGVSASYSHSSRPGASNPAASRWAFSGGIDIAETCALLGTKPEDGVTVADLARIFVSDAAADSVPPFLKGFSLLGLSFDYSHGGEEEARYNFDGVFLGEWELIDGFSAQLSVHLGDDGKVISADFDYKGIEFGLRYAFGESDKISGQLELDQGRLEGTYTPGDDPTLEIDFSSETKITLGGVIGWMVRAATQNRFFTLEPPWSSFLNEVTLPTENVSLLIHLKSKQITFQLKRLDLGKFGVRITGIGLTYDPDKKSADSSGLSMTLSGSGVIFAGANSDLSWDPAKEQAPVIPGQGRALLDMQMAAAGQYIGFDPDPAQKPQSVDAAVQAVSDALAAMGEGSFYPDALVPGRDYGWLLSSRFVILGQADIQLIFADPDIYGLLLEVTASGDSPPTKLDALAGLRAEILYRKVSETIGEYQGTLTLPDSIAKIDYNALEITLPSIALAIYTNGDFMIDVGFPHKRDFSRSFSITGGIYSGAGGFYYAKLDGLDPSSLPQVPADVGVFNPVTEIGIGFRIGMVRGFSSGPLTAELSLTLQALFEGTFATFTRYADNRKDEFYAVRASVAVIGHLVGKIDFAVIQATVEVTLFVELDLDMIAHRKALAEVSVGVSVKVTLKINCGFFSIHIHFSFETTIRQQIAFGENTPALWDQPRLAARAALEMAAGPSRIGWQPIADEAPLTVYFIPQLTAGRAYPATDGALHWYYVGQLALSNPAPSADPAAKFANAAAPSYAQLLRGLLRWGLYAIDNAGGALPVSKADAEAKRISRAQIEELLEALSGGGEQQIRPALGDVGGLFKHGFQTTIARPQTRDGCAELSVGFFPILPDMDVRIQAGELPARSLAASAPLSQAQLQRAKQRGPADALAAVAFDDPGAEGPPDEEARSIQAHLLIDYLMLALRSGLQKILDLPELFEHEGEQKTIGQILAALDDNALSSISGMTTRFMLHGTRLPAEEGDDRLQPLYALTGQQARLDPEDLAADRLAMTLSWNADSQADWAAEFEEGGTALSLSSADPEPVMFSPAEIPETPAFDLSGVTSEILPSADIRPLRFHLKSGIDGPETEGEPVSLWRLPPSLLDQLSDPESAALRFGLYRLGAGKGKSEPVEPERYSWTLAVDFRVRRIPEAGVATGEAYLENTYELVGVDQAGLLRLEQLIGEIEPETGAGPIAKLELGYFTEEKAAKGSADGQDLEGHKLTLADVDFRNTFMVQSNFSTESRPEPRAMAMAVAEPDVDPRQSADFIYKLWTGGITNSGGYYLFHASGAEESGLSPSLFADGTATLTLIIRLKPTAPGSLPPYVTSVRTRGYPVEGAAESLYVAADALQAAHPTLRAGQIGLRVTRPLPAEPGGAGSYDQSLGQLYNLISGRIAKIGDQEMPLKGLPALIGPLDEDDDETQWHYRHVFPTKPAASSDLKAAGAAELPPDRLNPYRNIGETVSFELLWTDLYGNQWDAFSPALAAKLSYFDSLVSLQQLPYLTLDYSFEPRAGGDPELVIEFHCLLPAYEECDGERKGNDLAAYGLAYYQLTPTDKGYGIESALETSLITGAGLAVETKRIRDNIAAIYCELQKVPLGDASGGRSVPLAPLRLEVPTGDAAFNQGLYFPLTVSLVLQRNGPIDPTAELPSDSEEGGRAPGPVRRVSLAIAPRMAGPADKTKSLAAFAKAFQAAFSAHDLLLAVGSSWRQGRTARSDQIWAVRYGAKGIKVSFTGEPAYFAPRPLSNKLLSRKVPVRRLESDGTLSAKAAEISVADMDLDAEMKRFLAAVDRMFSPENAIPATLVNAPAVDLLSRSKKDLVEQLVGYVTNLAEGGVEDSVLKAAQERYRQECLIRLEAFYDLASVAVAAVKAEIAVPHEGAPLKLFGHPIKRNGKDEESDSEQEFSLTPGKCALAAGDPVPMAIGLFAKHKSRYKVYRAELEFSLDALEHDVKTLSINDRDYAVGNWLRFVDPQPPLPMAAVSIPIPLRAFPELPQLTGQFAKALIGDANYGQTTEPNLLLKRVKSWALLGGYRQDYAAQDKVHLDVQLNIGLDGAPRALAMAGRERDLLDTLVEFNQLYPQLQDLFQKQGLSGIRTPEQAESADVLKAALQSFAMLVESVAQISRAQSWAPAALAMQREDTGLIKRQSRYSIEDGAGVSDAEDDWQSVVTFEQDIEAPVGIMPQLMIDGYKTHVESWQLTFEAAVESPVGAEPQRLVEDEETDPELCRIPPGGRETITYRFESLSDPGSYLKAAEAWRMPSRSAAILPVFQDEAAFCPLNIVDRQNGLLSMMIRRNEDLPAAFHYETPLVAYKEKVAPLLVCALPIQMAGLGAPQGTPVRRSLEDHLTAFFSVLLEGSGTGDAPLGSFQAVAHFDYPTSSGLALSPISLPIIQRLPTAVTFGAAPAGPPSYVSEMAAFIAAWLEENQLTPKARKDLWAVSRIRLEVSLFARVSETGQPILHLRNVQLPCEFIELN